MSTTDQTGKVRQPKTDVLTTDPRSHPKLTRHDTRLVFKKSRSRGIWILGLKHRTCV